MTKNVAITYDNIDTLCANSVQKAIVFVKKLIFLVYCCLWKISLTCYFDKIISALD